MRTCGDNIAPNCDSWENCASCPLDCGACSNGGGVPCYGGGGGGAHMNVRALDPAFCDPV